MNQRPVRPERRSIGARRDRARASLSLGVTVVAVGVLAVLALSGRPSLRPGVSPSPNGSVAPSPSRSAAADASGTAVGSEQPSPATTSASAPPSELRAALENETWAFVGPGGWHIGNFAGRTVRYGATSSEVELRSDWGRIVETAHESGSWQIGLVDPTSARRAQLAVVQDPSSHLLATVNRSADKVYFHASGDGRDGGVSALDPKSGRVDAVVPARALDRPMTRGLLLWSPTGRRSCPTCATTRLASPT